MIHGLGSDRRALSDRLRLLVKEVPSALSRSHSGTPSVGQDRSGRSRGNLEVMELITQPWEAGGDIWSTEWPLKVGVRVTQPP